MKVYVLPEDLERDLAALVAADADGGTLFKYLSVGDRFVFSKDHADKPYAILIKTATGYRHEVGGKLFKTGARTAVFKIADGG
jgi:hypothetical protein